jgi:hypothetical protein
MRHSKAIHVLDAYDRSELPAAVESELEAHLAACEACSRHAEKALALNAFLGRAAAEGTPEGFDAALTLVRQQTLRAIRLEQADMQAGLLATWLRRLGWAPLAVPATVAAGLVIALLVRYQGTAVAPIASGPSPAVSYVSGPSNPEDFRLVRQGAEVKIEWARNGGHQHKVRKAADPVSVKVASGQVVRGKTWNEGEAAPAPGSVTYYLID